VPEHKTLWDVQHLVDFIFIGVVRPSSVAVPGSRHCIFFDIALNSSSVGIKRGTI
jgi:hypothetical protein